LGLGNFNPDPTGGIVNFLLMVSQFSLEISSSKIILIFLLKPEVLVLVVVLVLVALVDVVLIFRCLLCLGIGSGVLKELQSELLLDDPDPDDRMSLQGSLPVPPEVLEQAEEADSEELPHEDVLMLDDAEWLLSLILCSNEALLLEVSLLLEEVLLFALLPPEVVLCR
jgi:hypothetical protein